MNVRELIEILEDCDQEAEVLLAHQPSYPLQFTLRGVATSDDLVGETRCDQHDHYSCDECVGDREPVVYLAEGHHPDHPYADAAIWDVARSY